jgi:hypothetical protein
VILWIISAGKRSRADPHRRGDRNRRIVSVSVISITRSEPLAQFGQDVEQTRAEWYIGAVSVGLRIS